MLQTELNKIYSLLRKMGEKQPKKAVSNVISNLREVLEAVGEIKPNESLKINFSVIVIEDIEH